MPGLKSPLYTQYPNEVLDAIHELKESELKVISVICRYTFGFHRTKWKAKLTTLMEKTGLSRQGVLNGTKGLIERGWIKQNKQGVSEWEVQFEDEVYLVDQESLPSRPPSKKEIKRNNSRGKPRDERLDHPAIKEYRSKARYHVPVVLRDDVIKTVGDDFEEWGKAIKYWIGKGWKPTNIGGMLEVYKKKEYLSQKKEEMPYA